MKSKRKIVRDNRDLFKEHMENVEREGQSGEQRTMNPINRMLRELDRKEKFGKDAYDIVEDSGMANKHKFDVRRKPGDAK